MTTIRKRAKRALDRLIDRLLIAVADWRAFSVPQQDEDQK